MEGGVCENFVGARIGEADGALGYDDLCAGRLRIADLQRSAARLGERIGV